MLMGWYASDLKKLGELMDMYPNMYAGLVLSLLSWVDKPRSVCILNIRIDVFFW